MRMAVTVLLVMQAACALTDMTVVPPEKGVATNLGGGRGRAVQLILPLSDERPDRSRCGMKKNSYNMHTADVHCSAEPSRWLGDLLAGELRAAGFTVVSTTESRPDAVRFEGRLLQYYLEPDVGFFTFTPEADVHVRLVATTPSGLNAERDFYVKGVETSLGGFESNFQAASDKAVRQIVKDMVTAVLQLMDRYPALGAPPGARSAL